MASPNIYLELVRLAALMERTEGRPEILVALVDGPVASGLPALPSERIRNVVSANRATCTLPESIACGHGTFVAGILSAERGSPAPSICPGCTLLVHPIFQEEMADAQRVPSATPEVLAAAIVASVEQGAHVINLSLALQQPSARGDRELNLALDLAAQRGAIVVAAAGNEATIGSSALTRHPWVIPVTGCDAMGAPIGVSNLGASIGRRGLAGPGAGVTSLRFDGKPAISGGTSIAAPFVSGAIALLWSERPSASAASIKQAMLSPHTGRRRAIIPPLLDAWGAYRSLQKITA